MRMIRRLTPFAALAVASGLAVALTLAVTSPRLHAEPEDPEADDAPAAAADPADYVAEIEAWRARREEGLTSEGGWLTLVGLAWLAEGENTVGSAPGSAVPLPEGKAPARVGVFVVEGDRARFEAAPGAGVLHEGEPVTSIELMSDGEVGTKMLELGDLSFFLIRRGERIGVRSKDKAHPARFAFSGIDSYPIEPAWRIEGRFVPYSPPRTLPIPTILGEAVDNLSPGAIEFELGGETHRLDGLGSSTERPLFVIFGDPTNGRETYGGGRYLSAGPPTADGRITIDFNKAYNPPCVFTAFATCPLPPPQNRLKVRIEAGEKTYAAGKEQAGGG